METKMQIADLKNLNEKIFKVYFERCTRKKIDYLNANQRLLLLEAQHSDDPLNFLYCHMQ